MLHIYIEKCLNRVFHLFVCVVYVSEQVKAGYLKRIFMLQADFSAFHVHNYSDFTYFQHMNDEYSMMYLYRRT